MALHKRLPLDAVLPKKPKRPLSKHQGYTDAEVVRRLFTRQRIRTVPYGHVRQVLGRSVAKLQEEIPELRENFTKQIRWLGFQMSWSADLDTYIVHEEII